LSVKNRVAESYKQVILGKDDKLHFMSKEIEKIIKKVQLESDKRVEKMLKRHTGALVEEFQHRVSAIGEQYGSIQKTLNGHTKTLNSHTEQIGKLMVKMTSVESEIKDIKSDVKNLRADNLEMRSDIKQVKFDIKFDLDRKIDKTQFVDLEGRVRILEKK
jgi:septation ring formation regulator EzrA